MDMKVSGTSVTILQLEMKLINPFIQHFGFYLSHTNLRDIRDLENYFCLRPTLTLTIC